MDTFDKFLNNNLQNDLIDLDLDNSAFNHLHYLVNLNSTKSDVKKNSIFSFLSDFVSSKFIAAKLAFFAVLFILLIGNKENKVHNSLIFLCDSTIIQNNSFDTTATFNNQVADSLFN
ncbi:MAG: hypothetical protein JEY96_02710 [Bacteroidales bacterium]|nr:hypothetical protein [Bacteroidales bacterium]